jgi:SAM-dependent methyltransferase
MRRDDAGDARVVLVLDPGRAFGSGHHPTTLGCLEALGELDLAGRSVIDVGCGSGVLAIAAARRGATVVAVDVDEEAVRATRDNAARNGVTLDVRRGGPEVAGSADVVVANLVTGTLVALAEALVAATATTLIVSGVVAERAATVRAALTTAGVTVDSVRERDGWVVIVGRRGAPRDTPRPALRRALAAGAVALLAAGCGGGPDLDGGTASGSDTGTGLGGATQPEQPDATGDALRARLDVLDTAVADIEDVLRSVADEEDLETAQRRGRYAMSLLVDSPATDPSTVALLPSSAAERDADTRRPDLLTETVTLASDDTTPLARVVLELLRDPIAGDIGAWQRDPAGVVAQARAAVDEGRGADLDTLVALIGELDGDATRAYAWSYALSLAPDLDAARARAARGAAHLAVVRVGISIALEDAGTSTTSEEDRP